MENFGMAGCAITVKLGSGGSSDKTPKRAAAAPIPPPAVVTRETQVAETAGVTTGAKAIQMILATNVAPAVSAPNSAAPRLIAAFCASVNLCPGGGGGGGGRTGGVGGLKPPQKMGSGEYPPFSVAFAADSLISNSAIA